MDDCVFCQIARKEIPAEIVCENETALGFLDINPISPGHTMIISKIHAANILDLPDELIEGVFKAVKQMTTILHRAFNPQGFTIGINQGRVSGQAIDHLHIHIIPRFTGDGGGSLHSVVHNPPKESLEVIRSKIMNVSK